MAYQYKVVRPFKDKNTGKKYDIAEIYPKDECSSKRFKELFFQENKHNQQYIIVDVRDNAKKDEILEVAEFHNIQVTSDNTKAEILNTLEG